MLNRVAESFYWMGRYAERADHTARLINVNYHSHPGFTEEYQEGLQNRLRAIVGNTVGNGNGSDILEFMTFSQKNENSIVNCLSMTRHNVRVVRERLSGKIWDSINSSYLWLKEQDGTDISVYSFYEQIQQRVALFHGITDATMLRENEWNFIQAGKSLERIDNILRMLQAGYAAIETGHNKDEYQRLLTLLECVDGVEAFRKFHANEVNIKTVTEFLVLNQVFPRSISFSFDELEKYLRDIQHEYRLGSVAKVIRLVIGIKVNFLTFLDLEHATIDQLQVFLQELLTDCNKLGLEIAQCFFQENEEEYADNVLHRVVRVV